MPDHLAVIGHAESTALGLVDRFPHRLAGAGLDEMRPARIAAAKKRPAVAALLN